MAFRKDNKLKTNFSKIRVSLASPEQILENSYGEVTKHETVSYRTLKPERDGLYCERIFGPVKDYECHCGKYKGNKYRGITCDRCGVEVTQKMVRRERMGHIALKVPVVHVWYSRSIPNKIAYLLGFSSKELESIIYYDRYVVIQPGVFAVPEGEAPESHSVNSQECPKYLEAKQLLKNEHYEQFCDRIYEEFPGNDSLENSDPNKFIAKSGAEAIYDLLANIDLDVLADDLRNIAQTATSQQKKAEALKRLPVVEAFRASAGINRPEWMVLKVIPVIPPDLRPLMPLDGGRFATSDLNDLYIRVITRNNRLGRMIEANAPEVIMRNEKRMLQEAVDALFDNSRKTSALKSDQGRALKSLSDSLKGKQGRFRQNLLGKRVDYSARSVIVVGPELKMNECGLPKDMAAELYKPFVMRKLIERGIVKTEKSAKKIVDRRDPVIWEIVENVIKGHPVLLNRAPTLHRLGIQAFQPKLIEGKAIQLPPLSCAAFNADFDGDQMAVHLPLSDDAQAEARELMSAVNNLLKPADGSPVLSISQDIVLGNYYLTYEKPSVQTEHRAVFANSRDAELAYDMGRLHLQSPIRVRAKGEIHNTTLGRVFFNEILPDDFPYNNNVQTKKELKKVLAQIFDRYGAEETAKTADRMKGLAFRFATVAAVSTGKDDYVHLDQTEEIIQEGDKHAALIADQYDQGLITDDERYNLTVAAWRKVDNQVTKLLQDNLHHIDTSISIMVNSGARGDISNVKLASAMIGIQVDAANREIELPIRSYYTRGLSSLESFVATRGSRKGLIDTALKTADSGYLTRRLVDVSQDVFTVEDEEGDDEGYMIYRSETEETMISFGNRLYGRYTRDAVPGYIGANELITREIANKIEADTNINEVKIQSILSTNNLEGIPRRSYGIDMATNELVGAAQPVGVIAAQSVGEPGTQLTLRTFHNSGVAGSDITQGLPRVEELFEARNPKGQAYITEVAGTVDVWEDGKKYIVQVTPEAGRVERLPLEGRKPLLQDGSSVKAGDILAEGLDNSRSLVAPFDGVVEAAEDTIVIAANAAAPVRYEIPGTAQLVVSANDHVEAGDRLTIGSLNLHDLMRLKGTEATQRYIINEVLRIYAAQGQDVADKHLEIIVRQMFSRVQIEDPGDSDFVMGDIVSKARVVAENKALVANGKEPAQYAQMLLGITKVSIWSDSWLSAASFQDTTRVLINAATSGRADHLHGLKENVIIGRKIPVGTGVRSLDTGEDDSPADEYAESVDEEADDITPDVDAES